MREIQEVKDEWLLANGMGGFASSTILGVNARKYHSWLSVVDPKLGEKLNLLSRVELEVWDNGKWLKVTPNQYVGGVFPEGIELQVEEVNGHSISFEFSKKEIRLSFEIGLVPGQDECLIKYKNKGQVESRVRLTPLYSYRNIHRLTQANQDVDLSVNEWLPARAGEKTHKISPYWGMPSLYIKTPERAHIEVVGDWYRGVLYSIEEKRGFPALEDLFYISTVELEIPGKGEAIVGFSTNEIQESLGKKWKKNFPVKKSKKSHNGLAKLKERAGDFIIENKALGTKSVVAGYPWFDEWGRDALISVPGLCFYTGRVKEGLEVLESFAKTIKNGIIPNYLSIKVGGEPSFNSIDASLWFFWSINEYYERTGRKDVVKKKFKSAMAEIIKGLIKGEPGHSRVDENGLLWSGDPSTQLTWMDARAHGKPVTPRYGYAVEVNGLWLLAMGLYVELFPRDELSRELKPLSKTAKERFVELFWSKEKGYLADVVNDGGQDLSLRPNQLMAVSHRYQPLKDSQLKSILTECQRTLLTPYGLRTLSPEDSRYIGRYEGGPDERDSSYHQGTVWTWLVGHYVEIALKTSENPLAMGQRLKVQFEPLIDELVGEKSSGSLPEIFDGDPPHSPRGCMAQAWSVAEVIRSFELIENLGSKELEVE